MSAYVTPLRLVDDCIFCFDSKITFAKSPEFVQHFFICGSSVEDIVVLGGGGGGTSHMPSFSALGGRQSAAAAAGKTGRRRKDKRAGTAQLSKSVKKTVKQKQKRNQKQFNVGDELVWQGSKTLQNVRQQLRGKSGGGGDDNKKTKKSVNLNFPGDYERSKLVYGGKGAAITKMLEKHSDALFRNAQRMELSYQAAKELNLDQSDEESNRMDEGDDEDGEERSGGGAKKGLSKWVEKQSKKRKEKQAVKKKEGAPSVNVVRAYFRFIVREREAKIDEMFPSEYGLLNKWGDTSKFNRFMNGDDDDDNGGVVGGGGGTSSSGGAGAGAGSSGWTERLMKMGNGWTEYGLQRHIYDMYTSRTPLGVIRFGELPTHLRDSANLVGDFGRRRRRLG